MCSVKAVDISKLIHTFKIKEDSDKLIFDKSYGFILFCYFYLFVVKNSTVSTIESVNSMSLDAKICKNAYVKE